MRAIKLYYLDLQTLIFTHTHTVYCLCIFNSVFMLLLLDTTPPLSFAFVQQDYNIHIIFIMFEHKWNNYIGELYIIVKIVLKIQKFFSSLPSVEEANVMGFAQERLVCASTFFRCISLLSWTEKYVSLIYTKMRCIHSRVVRA